MLAKPAQSIIRVIEALSRRDRTALEALAEPDIEVRVHAVPGVAERANEDLWRNVSLHGGAELRDYLNRLFEKLPSLTMLIDSVGEDAGWLRLAAVVSGVDGDGSPFEAYASIHARAGDGTVRSFDCEISHVGVGPDLLRSDPRRYLTYFLHASDSTHEEEGAA
jgi:hypothetical protein